MATKIYAETCDMYHSLHKVLLYKQTVCRTVC